MCGLGHTTGCRGCGPRVEVVVTAGCTNGLDRRGGGGDGGDGQGRSDAPACSRRCGNPASACEAHSRQGRTRRGGYTTGCRAYGPQAAAAGWRGRPAIASAAKRREAATPAGPRLRGHTARVQGIRAARGSAVAQKASTTSAAARREAATAVGQCRRGYTTGCRGMRAAGGSGDSCGVARKAWIASAAKRREAAMRAAGEVAWMPLLAMRTRTRSSTTKSGRR